MMKRAGELHVLNKIPVWLLNDGAIFEGISIILRELKGAHTFPVNHTNSQLFSMTILL
jgi:hypothetical protein